MPAEIIWDGNFFGNTGKVYNTWTDADKSAGEKQKSMDITDTTIMKFMKKAKVASTSTTISNLISTEKSKEYKSTDITILKEALITFFRLRSSILLFIIYDNKQKKDGLIKAMNNNWDITLNTSDLVALDKYVENEDKSTLLERKFMFWSKSDNEPKLQKDKSGVVNSQILVKQPSNYCGILDGHVIIIIGF
ncbi:hypothetical protein C1645_822751 [Glomus cerebriforme]|uniref:Uncharacterized protein n=1 Tax=Glomus cerebriforme TaxID=658196 RepID=A0A397SZA6_9GLOM|nr:hypothetical protein C1645_822751 [Glomus cerebriforme]